MIPAWEPWSVRPGVWFVSYPENREAVLSPPAHCLEPEQDCARCHILQCFVQPSFKCSKQWGSHPLPWAAAPLPTRCSLVVSLSVLSLRVLPSLLLGPHSKILRAGQLGTNQPTLLCRQTHGPCGGMQEQMSSPLPVQGQAQLI